MRNHAQSMNLFQEVWTSMDIFGSEKFLHFQGIAILGFKNFIFWVQSAYYRFSQLTPFADLQ